MFFLSELSSGLFVYQSEVPKEEEKERNKEGEAKKEEGQEKTEEGNDTTKEVQESAAEDEEFVVEEEEEEECFEDDCEVAPESCPTGTVVDQNEPEETHELSTLQAECEAIQLSIAESAKKIEDTERLAEEIETEANKLQELVAQKEDEAKQIRAKRAEEAEKVEKVAIEIAQRQGQHVNEIRELVEAKLAQEVEHELSKAADQKEKERPPAAKGPHDQSGQESQNMNDNEKEIELFGVRFREPEAARIKQIQDKFNKRIEEAAQAHEEERIKKERADAKNLLEEYEAERKEAEKGMTESEKSAHRKQQGDLMAERFALMKELAIKKRETMKIQERLKAYDEKLKRNAKDMQTENVLEDEAGNKEGEDFDAGEEEETQLKEKGTFQERSFV